MTHIHTIPPTLDDYFILAEQINEPIEFIHGQMIIMTRPTPTHQVISGLVFVFLWFCIRKIGGRAFQDVDVVLDEQNSVAPDLVYLKADNTRCDIGEKWLYGVPDLVIEVLSASTAKRDRDEKYRLYEQVGVTEYWLIDPANQYIEIFVLTDGVYKRFGVFAPKDTFISPTLGQVADVSTLLSELD